MEKLEKQIVSLMETLEISREEAKELVAFDNEEFELEEVQELTKKAKEVAPPVKRGRQPKADKEKTKRTKKENSAKVEIIKALEKAVLEELGISSEMVEVTNREKTIIFQAFGETFEIDLKQKRKPKA